LSRHQPNKKTGPMNGPVSLVAPQSYSHLFSCRWESDR